MKNTIGNNIAQYRKEAGMTQADLAEKMNVSVQAVSKWENDISCPDLERIGQLASVLGSTAESIINGERASVTSLKSDIDYSKRIIVFTVNVHDGDNVDVTLRIPMELFLKARQDGTLETFLGECGEDIPESVFEMITSGVVGPIATVNNDEVSVSVEVVEYDC